MFFAIPNRISHTVTPVAAPWDVKVDVPASAMASLEAYTAWRASPSTKAMLISGYEGLDAGARVSTTGGNRALKVHAFIADYDVPVSAEVEDSLLDARFSDYLPTHFCRSFRHARLVWQLSEPVLVPANERERKSFLSTVSSELCLGKWLAGLDAAAFGLATNYYDVLSWTPLHTDYRIPAAHVGSWMFHAIEKCRVSLGGVKIPLDIVAAEMEARFPGKWKGPFELGSRGIRFWDPTSVRDDGAMVSETGMRVWSGNEQYLSWKQIFGSAFVEKFEADKIGTITQTTYVDDLGRFWIREDDGRWASYDRSTFHTLMRCRGFDQGKPRGVTFSEMDMLEVSLQKTNRVKAAVPLAGFPAGLTTINGELFVNTKEAKFLAPGAPYKPQDTPVDWDKDGPKHFPFLYKFTNQLYREDKKAGELQIMLYLRWLQQAYQHLVWQNPQPGPVLVRGGGRGGGKTAHEQQIHFALLGESADPTDYLRGRDKWTDRLTGTYLWVMDDSVPLETDQEINAFTAKLKSMVATTKVVYEKKYHSACDVPWMGRVSVTANLDVGSARALPSFEHNSLDKMLILCTGHADILAGMSRASVTQALAPELPLFGRFLMDWVAPEEVCAGRFHVKMFAHPDVMEAANANGSAEILLSTLIPWIDTLRTQKEFAKTQCWDGTTAQLLDALGSYNETVRREFRTVTLGRALGNLARHGKNVVRRTVDGCNRWTVGFDINNEAKQQEEIL